MRSSNVTNDEKARNAYLTRANANHTIAVIILAAGASVRLGEPKQLVRFEGRTLLRRAIDAAVESACHPVLVVVGAQTNLMRAEIADSPVQIVECARWNEGMSESIRAGIHALKSLTNAFATQAVIIMLCDQPFVTAATLSNLVAAYHETRKHIIASEYAGTRGVPALFHHTLFAELESLIGAQGARHVIANHPPETFGVPFPGGDIDIDTPEDYRRLVRAPETIVES